MEQQPNFRLDNRTAVVTGATRGIGRGVSAMLASAGASVAVAGRDLEALRRLADEINGTGGTAWPVHLDVTDLDGIAAAMEAVVAEADAINAQVAGWAFRIPAFKADAMDQRLADVLREPGSDDAAAGAGAP